MKSPSGQTLIELLMVIVVIGIVAYVSIDAFSDVLNEMRFEATKKKLTLLRRALIGDPTLKEAGMRSSYGYLGDVGRIPNAGETLTALWTKPGGVAAYAQDSTSRLGLGWNGPYVNATGSGVDFTKDGWGNDFVYSPAASPPTVVSLGSDGAVGGNGFAQDITMEMPTHIASAKVHGLVVNLNAQWSGAADIELYQPDGVGGLQTLSTSIVAGDNGYFTISGVSLGLRSATVYIPNKAAPTKTIGPVVFSVAGKNFLIPVKSFDVGI